MSDTITELEQQFQTNTFEETEKEEKHYVHIVNPPSNLHIQYAAQRDMTAKEIVEFARDRGMEVICLCGYRFVPSRSPEVVNDTCPICLDVAGMLMRNNGE